MLPRLPHRDLCDISSGKIDYVFSFSPRSLEIDEILWQFDRQQIPLGLTTDPSLSSTPLFAGVIVRDKSGNVEEARLQLSLLFAAQFKKLTQLGKLQGKDISGCQQPLMLGWTVIGSDWCLYYAYRYISEGNETMVRYTIFIYLLLLILTEKFNSMSIRPSLPYIQTRQQNYTMESSSSLILYTGLLHIWRMTIGLFCVISCVHMGIL